MALSDIGSMGWTGDPKNIPTVALGALALGAAGRLGKNFFDLVRGKDKQRFVPLRPPVSKVPVEVSEEEAEELRRRGINVSERAAKLAEAKAAATDYSIPGAVGYGALGAGAGIAGWKLIDYLIDKDRRAEAKRKVQDVRGRIEKLLQSDPYEQDVKIAAYMDGAADTYLNDLNGSLDEDFKKEALFGVSLLPALGVAAGGGAMIAGISAYNRARKGGKSGARIAELKKYFKRRGARRPMMGMSPYVVKRQEEEEEDQEQAVVNRAEAIREYPVLQPVVETRPAGSPAQQAAQTTF